MNAEPSTSPAARRRARVHAAALAVVVAAVGVAAGCTAAGTGLTSGPAPHSPATGPSYTVPAGVADLGAGFLGENTAPTPAATLNPEPGSWDGVEPPAGYSIAVISRGTDAATQTIVSAVKSWGSAHAVTVTELPATTDDDVEDRIDQAVAAGPDLVVGAGAPVVDVFSLITSQYLEQQFLVVGAELPEPTDNVTAVVWPGATFRGTGLGDSAGIDDTSVTPARSAQAVSAGVASVVHGIRGYVLFLQ